MPFEINYIVFKSVIGIPFKGFVELVIYGLTIIPLWLAANIPLFYANIPMFPIPSVLIIVLHVNEIFNESITELGPNSTYTTGVVPVITAFLT